MNLKLASMLLSLGLVGLVAAGGAGTFVIFMAHYAGMTGPLVTAVAIYAAIAAGFSGFALDAKYGLSSWAHEAIWQREIAEARSRFKAGALDYQDALEKVFRASFELSQPAIYLFRPFFWGGLAKKNRDDKFWVSQNVLPLIGSHIDLYQERELRRLEGVVRELTDDLLAVRPKHGIFQSIHIWVAGDQTDLVREVANRWLVRNNLPLLQPIAPTLLPPGTPPSGP